MTFNLRHFDADGKETAIGSVKILQCDSQNTPICDVRTTTELPERFDELDERFISLGQSEEYYAGLRQRLPKEAHDALNALRDISWQPALATPFEPTSAFRNALLRSNTAHRARRFGRALALGQEPTESFSFRYSFMIDGAAAPTEAYFPFATVDRLPGRIVCVIGRNAVGKTRLLAHLASDLAQVHRSSADRLTKRDARFPDGRPLFTRVLGVSYSAFDHFERPSASPFSSYVYCGIRNDRGVLSRNGLIETYRANQARIRAARREREWTSHMEAILGPLSPMTERDLAAEITSTDSSAEPLSLLSSGQAILSHFVTALLAWIEPHSLVLFDEPETHLHPNAVATLFSVLVNILAKYDSYAVIATHSPIVIQQVPGKRVVLLRRTGNVTEAEPISVETFGESIAELTRHVFETIDVSSHCRQTLTELAKSFHPDEVFELFDLGLNLSAKSYVLSQWARRNRGGA